MSKIILILIGIILLGGLAYTLNRTEQATAPIPDVQIDSATSVVRIRGKMICLPHRDTTGPQTLECALGLQDDEGNNYALSDTDPEYRNISSISQNQTVTVEGILKPQPDSKYAVVGVIEISSVQTDAMGGIPEGYTLEDYEIAESLEIACTADQECQTPPEYMVRSNCPYTTLCLESTCKVVCPTYSQ